MNKFLVLVLFGLIVIASAKPQKRPTCNNVCTADYTPVCGGPASGNERSLTFGNSCVLNTYNCENGKNYIVKSQGECPGGGGVRLQ